VTDVLPDPCSICGFDGSSLHPPEIVATLRSLGRRWAAALAGNRGGGGGGGGDGDGDGDGDGGNDDVARRHAEGALDGLLAAARPIRAEVGRFGTRPDASAAGIASAAEAIADALEGPDKPFERPGVPEAAAAAAHAGIHHLRLAEKAR